MIKNLLLSFLSIFISLLLVEAVLRYVYTPPPLQTRMQMVEGGLEGGDATLEWSAERMAYAPEQTASIAHLEYNHTATIDDYGFRNPCLAEPLEGLMVGDSSVFSIGVHDNESFQCVGAERGHNAYTIGIPGAPPSYLISLVEKHMAPLRERYTFKDEFYIQYVLSIGNDFSKLVTFKGRQTDNARRNKTESAKGPDQKNEGDSLAQIANKLIYHDSPLRYSYFLQTLKLVGLGVTPQCQDCSYLDLRGGDRVYKTEVSADESSRHLSAILNYIDAATEAALAQGASEVQFILIRGAHIISPNRLRRELELQSASRELFNIEYQSEIFARAAEQRPNITIIDSTECLRRYPEPDALHYQFDGHFTKTGIATFIDCLSEP